MLLVLILGSCYRRTPYCEESEHCPAGLTCSPMTGVCEPQADMSMRQADMSMRQADLKFPGDLVRGPYAVQIAGAVQLNQTPTDMGSDKASRVTQGPCPGAPYIMPTNPATIAVIGSELGRAKWECTDPSFFYGDTFRLGMGTPLILDTLYLFNKTQAFVFTSPPGYACEGAYHYVRGKLAAGTFTNSMNKESCTLQFSLPEPDGGKVPDLYLWFKVSRR